MSDTSITTLLVQDLLIPAAVIVGVCIAFASVFKMLQSLYVSGEANEWVLIMRNGKMVKAGVGLSCFRAPFDQVATFPAQVKRVTFKSE